MDESDGKRADYGLDAPLVMRNLALVGGLCLLAGRHL